jgi:hypothetical protein
MGIPAISSVPVGACPAPLRRKTVIARRPRHGQGRRFAFLATCFTLVRPYHWQNGLHE